jgi:hypothetical protein
VVRNAQSLATRALKGHIGARGPRPAAEPGEEPVPISTRPEKETEGTFETAWAFSPPEAEL